MCQCVGASVSRKKKEINAGRDGWSKEKEKKKQYRTSGIKTCEHGILDRQAKYFILKRSRSLKGSIVKAIKVQVCISEHTR